MPDRGKELYALALETLSKSAKKAEIRQKFETTSSDGSSDSDSDSESEKADDTGPDWPAASHDLRISRIKVFLFEGCFSLMSCDWSAAIIPLTELVDGDATRNGDTVELLACGSMMLGWALCKLGEVDAGIKYYERAANSYAILRDGVGRAASLMGMVGMKRGKGQMDVEEIKELLGECYEIAAGADIPALQVASLEGLSDLHSAAGDVGVAKDLSKRAVKVRGGMGGGGGLVLENERLLEEIGICPSQVKPTPPDAKSMKKVLKELHKCKDVKVGHRFKAKGAGKSGPADCLGTLGTIVAKNYNGNGTFDVVYDGGKKEKNVPFKSIQLEEVGEHDVESWRLRGVVSGLWKTLEVSKDDCIAVSEKVHAAGKLTQAGVTLLKEEVDRLRDMEREKLMEELGVTAEEVDAAAIEMKPEVGLRCTAQRDGAGEFIPGVVSYLEYYGKWW